MLQSLPPSVEPPGSERVAQTAGFSLHAGVAAEADQRGKLERLCRYIARPAVAIERLSLTAQGHIRYALKTPYRDGTTHVIFEPPTSPGCAILSPVWSSPLSFLGKILFSRRLTRQPSCTSSLRYL